MVGATFQPQWREVSDELWGKSAPRPWSHLQRISTQTAFSKSACCMDSWYSTASELPLRVPSRIIPCVIDAPALKLEQEHDHADCVPVLSTERAVAKTARWVLQHERAVVVEDEVRLPREGPDGYASSLSKMKVRDGPDA